MAALALDAIQIDRANIAITIRAICDTVGTHNDSTYPASGYLAHHHGMVQTGMVTHHAKRTVLAHSVNARRADSFPLYSHTKIHNTQ